MYVISLFSKGSFGGMTGSESWLKRFHKIIIKRLAWKLLAHNSFQDYREEGKVGYWLRGLPAGWVGDFKYTVYIVKGIRSIHSLFYKGLSPFMLYSQNGAQRMNCRVSQFEEWSCSVVWWYSSRFFSFFCQMAAGWTDCRDVEEVWLPIRNLLGLQVRKPNI